MVNYTLYSRNCYELPDEELSELATPDILSIEYDGATIKSYHFDWPDVKLTLNLMPEDQIENHLEEFIDYVTERYHLKSQEPDRELIHRIQRTIMVLGIVIEPKFDVADEKAAVNKAIQIVGEIQYGTEGLLLCHDGLIDDDGNIYFEY